MKRTIIFLLAVLIVFPVFAERIPMPQVIMPTVASNGFGGHHVAYTDNVFSLLVNPAAMMRVQKRSFITLAPSVFNPESTFKLLGSVPDIMGGDLSGLGGILNTLSAQKGKIALGMELREFPFSIAWVANGFGFGLWNRTFINLNIKQTNLEADIFEDIMLPVGLSFRVFEAGGHTIDGGVTIKPFARVMAKTSVDILNVVGGGNFGDILDNIGSIPLVVGGTIDAGFLYRWNVGFSAGITFNDIFSYAPVVYDMNTLINTSGTGSGSMGDVYYIPFTMNLGVAYDFKLGLLWPKAPKFLANTGFTIAADWRNITNAFNQNDYLNSRNFLLDLGFGVKVCLFDILNVRVGMNEMLPSVGLGVDLGPVEIEAAYYGKEFGFEPGQFSTAMLELSLSIRPDAKKRNWPWTKRTIVGMFTGTN
jgi:hypothetical protein